MGNIALNRPTASSSCVKPYTAANAVSGTITPFSRWLCNTTPGWMYVDLGTPTWVNRWVVRHMPVAGWRSPDHVNCDFKLQGSNNPTSWIDLDPVVGNASSITDRTTVAAYFRYFRVYVTKGLKTNNQMASIMEFELYPAPPTSPYLSNLIPSAGTLNPGFSKTTTAYTTTVNNSVSSITLTPTAEDANATITVNGATVSSGTASQLVNLNIGSNTITVNVTSQIGGLVQNYTIVVTRSGSADLKTLVAQDNLGANVTLSPAFDKGIIVYTAKIDYDASTIAYIPTTDDPVATIKLNGISTPNGSISGATIVGNGISSAIEVSSTSGDKKTYTVGVSKNTSAYLTSVTLAGGRPSPVWNPTFARKTFNNGVTASTTPLMATVVKEDAAATLLVTCNGTILNPTSSSGNTATFNVTLNAGSNSLVIQVTSTSGDVKTYTFSITK